MEQVKSLIKDHLEKNKFFDTLKTAVAKDPKLNNIDRNMIIEKLKQEGILSDILNQLPVKKPIHPMSHDVMSKSPLRDTTRPINRSNNLSKHHE